MKIPEWVYSLKYVDGGRDKSGVDCWGLIVVLNKELRNIDIPDYPSIVLSGLDTCEKTSGELKKQLGSQNLFHEVNTPEYGDAVLINVMGNPLHIGFVLDDSMMLHTGRKHGVVTENFRGMKWKSKIAGIYRIW